MGIHGGAGQFPVDGMECSHFTHAIPHINGTLSWDVLRLHSLRQIVRNTDRHIRVCQKCSHERFYIFRLRRDWRLHADLADIICFSDICPLHSHTVFFIILRDQKTVSMHSRTQGITFLFHFLKCHDLPDLRILAVEQKQVWRFLRFALCHKIKEAF